MNRHYKTKIWICPLIFKILNVNKLYLSYFSYFKPNKKGKVILLLGKLSIEIKDTLSSAFSYQRRAKKTGFIFGHFCKINPSQFRDRYFLKIFLKNYI